MRLVVTSDVILLFHHNTESSLIITCDKLQWLIALLHCLLPHLLLCRNSSLLTGLARLDVLPNRLLLLLRLHLVLGPLQPVQDVPSTVLTTSPNTVPGLDSIPHSREMLPGAG